MREWCGCGAGIRGSVQQVMIWRTSHKYDNDTGPEQLQVPPTGAEARTELSYPDIDLSNHIGFTPNH